MKRLRRAFCVLIGSLILTAIALSGRALIATGLFTTVSSRFDGSCSTVAGPVRDLVVDTKGGAAFASARGGLLMARLDHLGEGFVRLRGTPADMDPFGLGLYRASDGAVVLMAIDRKVRDELAVESFDVHVSDGTVGLVERSRITSGLLSDPVGVVPVGPDAFYVTNGSTSKTALGRFLEAFALVSRGNVVFFDGTFFRKVVEGFSGASGIESSDDFGRLYVGTRLGRTLYAFDRNPFNGNLKELGELPMGFAIEGLRRDAKGSLWVTGHPDAIEGWSRNRPSEIYKVYAEGAPKNAQLVYADTGQATRLASVAAPFDDTLLIGSPSNSGTLVCRFRKR